MPEEEEWECQLVSVRGGKAAVVKARVTRRLLDDLRRYVPGKAAVPRGAVQLEVGAEYRLTDEHGRIAFVGNGECDACQ